MLCETETADGLNETQFHSLTAGGAYGTVIQHFLGYHCKLSSAACVNTHLNALYRGKMKRKRHVNLSENNQFPSETHSYKIQYLGFLYFTHHESCSACYGIFSSLRPSSASLASVNGLLQTNYNNNIIFPHKRHLGK